MKPPLFLVAMPLAVLAALPGPSRADCAPVIAAYAKAEATGRYAMFDVDSIASTPKGAPFQVDIGNVGYTHLGNGTYTRRGGGDAGAEAGSVKSREQKGSIRCEPIGERRIGSEAARGYRIRANDKSSQDPTAIHIWVATSSGLPLFHGMGSEDGGLRWVYGAEVAAPARVR